MRPPRAFDRPLDVDVERERADAHLLRQRERLVVLTLLQGQPLGAVFALDDDDVVEPVSVIGTTDIDRIVIHDLPQLGTEVPFQGRAALERQREEGLKKRLCAFTVDDPDVVLLGRETVLRDGEVVGWLTSGGFGYTVAKPIGYGYVRRAEGVTPEWLRAGRFELEVARERIPASLHLQPLYDPKMTRIRS